MCIAPVCAHTKLQYIVCHEYVMGSCGHQVSAVTIGHLKSDMTTEHIYTVLFLIAAFTAAVSGCF